MQDSWHNHNRMTPKLAFHTYNRGRYYPFIAELLVYKQKGSIRVGNISKRVDPRKTGFKREQTRLQCWIVTEQPTHYIFLYYMSCSGEFFDDISVRTVPRCLCCDSICPAHLGESLLTAGPLSRKNALGFLRGTFTRPQGTSTRTYRSFYGMQLFRFFRCATRV